MQGIVCGVGGEQGRGGQAGDGQRVHSAVQRGGAIIAIQGCDERNT